MKGKKIRVQEDKILVATFKALGMISTPIAFPEVATALQTKVIDFAEGGINTYYHNKFYDIVKNVADVRHTHQVVVLVMSKASWGKVDGETQKAIVEAGRARRAVEPEVHPGRGPVDPERREGEGRHHHEARPDPVP